MKLLLIIFLYSINIYSNNFLSDPRHIKIFDHYNIMFGSFSKKSNNFVESILDTNSSMIKSNNIGPINADVKIKTTSYDSEITFHVSVKFNEDVRFSQGLGLFIFNVDKNGEVFFKNHRYSATQKEFSNNTFNKVGMNLYSINNKFSIFFDNPFKSYFTYKADEGYIMLSLLPEFNTHWNFNNKLQSQKVEQTLNKNDSLSFEFTIIKDYSKHNKKNVYFSSIPNGYSELWAHIFDEIPLRFGQYTFSTFTTKEKTKHELYQKMLEFITQFPELKFLLLISYNYIEKDIGYNAVYEENKDLWANKPPEDIIGPCDLAKYAPDSFKIWLKNIETNKDYSWANRIGLGIHAWHHTYINPDGSVPANYYQEFKLYDSTETVNVIDKIYTESNQLGLTNQSRLFFRPPGLGANKYAIRKFIEKGVKLMDFTWQLTNEFKFVHAYNHNSAWGIHLTAWIDVFPDDNSYPDENYIYNDLIKGVPCETGGHPWGMFGGVPYSRSKDTLKWKTTYKLFKDIENRCEDLTFYRADSLGLFMDQAANIDNVNVASSNDSINKIFNITFSGLANQGETIVLDNYIASLDDISYIIYDDKNIPLEQIKIKRYETYIVLPRNNLIHHKLAIKFKTNSLLNKNITDHDLFLEQNYPNPFNPQTNIIFFTKSEGPAVIKVFSINGKLVKKININKPTYGYNHVVLNMSRYSSGVYVYKLISGNNILSKKMLYLK